MVIWHFHDCFVTQFPLLHISLIRWIFHFNRQPVAWIMLIYVLNVVWSMAERLDGWMVMCK